MRKMIVLVSVLVLGNLGAAKAEVAAAVPDRVLRNAPVFIGRRDQIRNPATDRILGLGYSLTETESGTEKIRYTTFFSDEDSAESTVGTDHQMAEYGRRLDVEWSYEIELDSRTGEVKGRTYQCDFLLGIGHRTCKFKGKYYANSDRPILYDNARHNIFGDRPKFPYGDAHGPLTVIDPSFEIPFPESRDMIPLQKPEWMRTSDEEIAREGRLSLPSTEYVYLRVRGVLEGHVHLSISIRDGRSFTNGITDQNSLQKLGADLWGQESVVAIPVPADIRFALKNGLEGFGLGEDSTKRFAKKTSELTLTDIGLYVLDRAEDGRYVTTDLSAKVHCTDPQRIGTCSVNER
jgi:hypothetical protein